MIVPARDAAATLPRTLDALARERPDEVIVVDDGSSDETRTIAAKAGAIIVQGPKTGPGGARNAGAFRAANDALVFLDADCVPAPGWLGAGLHALASADLVQGRVDPEPGVPIGAFDRTLSVTAAWGLFESANLFVRRSAFQRVGGFEDWLEGPDERLLGVTVRNKGLAEDLWLGWSMRRAGLTTAFSETALVHHAVFPRNAREYVAERLRLRHFPAIARRVPEIRGTFLRHRVFLTRRTLAFDAAVAGAVTSALARHPLPLVAAAPYVREALRTSRGYEQPRPQVAAVQLAADVVGFAALVRGSIAARTPVL